MTSRARSVRVTSVALPYPPRRVTLPTGVQISGRSYSVRPILFSASMITAILAGRKTQTRRLVRIDDRPILDDFITRNRRLDDPLDPRGYERGIPSNAQNVRMCGDYLKCDSAPGSITVSNRVLCPQGVSGDHLWVRETWAGEKKYDRRKPSRIPPGTRVWYLADGKKPKWAGRSRPSIFMMPWMSRIELEIVRVHVERVNAISEKDAAAEGVNLHPECPCEGDLEEPGPHVKLCRWNRKGWPGETPLGVDDPHRMAFAVLWDSINGKRSPFDDGAWVWCIDFKIFSAIGAR